MTSYTINVHADAETLLTARISHSGSPYGTLAIGEVTIFVRDAAKMRELAEAATALADRLDKTWGLPAADVWPKPTEEM